MATAIALAAAAAFIGNFMILLSLFAPTIGTVALAE
jgi:hypothetical protein